MQAMIIAANQEEREFLSYVLRHTGLAVARTSALKLVVNSMQSHLLDIIILAQSDTSDIVETVETIRKLSQAPLILILDTVTEEAQCDYLDAGIDLLLNRPVSPRILSRYVKVILRRSGSVPLSVLSPLEAEGISLDPETRTAVLADAVPQQLTPLEFRLLYVLMTNYGQVIPTEVIIERVWGYSAEGNRELVRGLVRRLRRKIEPDDRSPRFIHTHTGIGYRFSVGED